MMKRLEDLLYFGKLSSNWHY